MHLWMEKWGSAVGALLCALVIIFAAVYTRQDELRGRPAQNAAADQSQTLQSAVAARIALPVSAPVLSPFRGAYKENGLWKMDPCVYYQTTAGQEVRAIHAGTVTRLADGWVEITHENGLIACYQGLLSPIIQSGDAVAAGQCIARMTKSPLRFSLRQHGHYLNPEAFFAQYVTE